MRFLFVFMLLLTFEVGASNDTLHINQPTVLEIKDGKEIFQPESDWVDKYMGGIIALITIIGSALFSYGIAKHQTKKQEEINERQIETQIEIAKQQLELNQKQLEEQSKIAIDSVRANNISEARIQWIKELRPLLGTLIQNIDDFAQQIPYLKTFLDSETKKVRQNLNTKEKESFLKYTNEMNKIISDFESTLKQVKLFLNRHEEDHKQFLSITDQFINQAMKRVNEKVIEEEEIDEEALIKLAQKILKQAWEQAKNEGKR